MKLPTPLEAAARADEGHAVASGLGLDEVAALLRSMAQCSSGISELIEFFRNEGYNRFGWNGDERGWSTERTAIEAMRELVRLEAANYGVGKWLSAALDDPTVCVEMKTDINAWFKAHQPGLVPSTSRATDDCSCGGGDLSGHDTACPYALSSTKHNTS